MRGPEGAPVQQCTGATRLEEEMEELCIEGLANHDDREPCAGAREGAGEASVAARAGRAIEPRNHRVRGADAVYGSGRQHRQRRYRELLAGPARSDPNPRVGRLLLSTVR